MVKEFYEELEQLYASGDLEAVERFLRKKMVENITCCGRFSEIYLACASELGGLYRDTSKYQDSVEALTVAATLIAGYFGQESYEYAVNRNNIAGTYRLMGEWKKALSAFLEAKNILTEAGGKGDYFYATVLNNLALLYTDMGDFENAEECLLGAIRALDVLGGREEELAISYTNLSVLSQKRGYDQKASEYLDLALEKFRMCEGSYHANSALNLLAQRQYRSEQHAEAAQTYQKILTNIKSVYGENVEYAIACLNISKVYQAMGDREKMVQYHGAYCRAIEEIYGGDDAKVLAAKADHEKMGA